MSSCSLISDMNTICLWLINDPNYEKKSRILVFHYLYQCSFKTGQYNKSWEPWSPLCLCLLSLGWGFRVHMGSIRPLWSKPSPTCPHCVLRNITLIPFLILSESEACLLSPVLFSSLSHAVFLSVFLCFRLCHSHPVPSFWQRHRHNEGFHLLWLHGCEAAVWQHAVSYHWWFIRSTLLRPPDLPFSLHTF